MFPGGPIELFLIPPSLPQLVHHRSWHALSSQIVHMKEILLLLETAHEVVEEGFLSCINSDSM